jgi:hypothetical protein
MVGLVPAIPIGQVLDDRDANRGTTRNASEEAPGWANGKPRLSERDF